MRRDVNNLASRFPFLILFLFLFVAYLPVFLPFFHIKNDLITQNLPTRFFIGESLYSSHFPWWNPYMNFGFPQYADMNNGFWNPVLWFTAYFFRYSVLTITLEEMFYILIGGWGIYLLCRQMKNPTVVSLLCGMSYMTGGFIVGHLQHFCWITGTAFFPFVLLFFLKCLEVSSLRNFILGGTFSFLFLSATHPGLIIGAVYFSALALLYLLLSAQNRNSRISLMKVSLLFLVFGVLFSPIVWTSDIEGILQMTRGSKVAYESALSLPTSLPSYLSLLFPSAVNKGSFFNTDISMRNTSIGIIALIGVASFFIYSAVQKKVLIFLSLLFFVLLAAGIPKILFYHLPLLGFVRLNGEFSYFTFLILILSSARGLTDTFENNENKGTIIAILNLLSIIFASSLLASLLITIGNHGAISEIIDKNLKLFLDHIDFWDVVLINSIIQILFVLLYKKNLLPTHLVVIAFMHLVILTWLSLPFTGIGRTPRAEIQAIIDSVPRGTFKPYQKSILSNKYIDSKYKSLFLEEAFYSKQIGYFHELQYPVELRSTSEFFRDTKTQQFIYGQPYFFLSTDSTVSSKTNTDSTHLSITHYSPTDLRASVNNNGFKYLVLLQNNYPRWKVFVDNKPIQHFTIFKSFIGFPLEKGNHIVEYTFDTSDLKAILFLNILIVTSGLILVLFKNLGNFSLVRDKPSIAEKS